MLGSANVALFDGARTTGINQNAFVVDPQVIEHLPKAAAVQIVSNDTRQHDLGIEGP